MPEIAVFGLNLRRSDAAFALQGKTAHILNFLRAVAGRANLFWASPVRFVGAFSAEQEI